MGCIEIDCFKQKQNAPRPAINDSAILRPSNHETQSDALGSLSMRCPLTRLRISSSLVTAAVIAAMLSTQAGCVATKYKLAKKNTPPVQLLNVAFPPSAPLQPTFTSLISYGGPGSWKREALWDEYVVTLRNSGERPVTVDSAVLTDSAGTLIVAGSEPWALEKQSKLLEKQYKDRGEAFVRTAGPGVLIVGTGAAIASATATAGIVSSAAVGAALAVVALPVYYVTVLSINHHNKKAVMAEFSRRRLRLPLTLAAGETRTGSVFYPMVRAPHSLELSWSSESASGQAELPLDFLHGLHVPTVDEDAAHRTAPKL